MSVLKLTDEQLSLILSCAAELECFLPPDDESFREPDESFELLELFALDWVTGAKMALDVLRQRGMA